MQRTGTTSVGQFFNDHEYRVATWSFSIKNNWTTNWFIGDYEKIFRSIDFKTSQVFEDDPWWCLDFYKVIFHRFPKSKFVLIERDPDKWFDSMMKHSKGKSLGNTLIHSAIYQRVNEFNESKLNKSTQKNNLLPLNEVHRSKYKKIYVNRHKEVNNFFNTYGRNRIVRVRLEDKDKWQIIGAFFDIKVSPEYEVHVNKSI